ncbi:uroporphyrinogen-III C-methyltransferase [Catenovulum maritimum]|uniref:uroporphyrinogen-III C-methyltransferase n=1 Tax=Catenovulum maritimum TaxID=1513271 RepID=A0A0J8GS78_9ALTE|nr:uroporphyrinogen-III C-methyltransferase [Catenovulum maritimum]KMT65572.1 uroporphyrin-III methyltransferase [Catenovulum maritimum]
MFKLVKQNSGVGKVWLVGAGPGDADLLTIKALRAIQSADIILYDRLVSEDIRSLFPSNTPAFYVGKTMGNHCIPQDKLNELLVEKAQKGFNICRLKGGDPFVFGRGAEEMLVLRNSNIEVEVVPGVTAGIGAVAYAGIPVTHRGLSQACTFVTGHAEKEFNIDWQSLASLKSTLVFYMGLNKLPTITEQLLKHGLDANTPAALIENGCRNEQRVFTGKITDLEAMAKQNELQTPTLIVVGQVVELAESLQWYGTLTTEDSQWKQLSA